MIFLAAFATGFSLSPLKFYCLALGHTERGAFYPYQSFDFEYATHEFVTLDSPDEARAEFERTLVQINPRYNSEQEILERTDDRAVIRNKSTENETMYSVVLPEDRLVVQFHSKSLRHAKALERQYLAERLK